MWKHFWKLSFQKASKNTEARSRLGDWEGDTIVGKERTQRILTHVERVSLYLVSDICEKFLYKIRDTKY